MSQLPERPRLGSWLASLRDPWVLGQLLLFLLVIAGTAALRARYGYDPAAGTRILAIGLLVLGSLSILVAGLGLGRSLTPTIVPVEDGELATGGLYRWVRHPIYLAVILMLAGLALLAGRWLWALTVALVAYAYFDRKAAAEERHLLERYPDYAHYRARTGKLLPWIGRRR